LLIFAEVTLVATPFLFVLTLKEIFPAVPAISSRLSLMLNYG